MCQLFVETMDYLSYLHDHGCDFRGAFTCCDGINTTVLHTFALEICGKEDDVCSDYDVFPLLFWSFFVTLLIFALIKCMNETTEMLWGGDRAQYESI